MKKLKSKSLSLAERFERHQDKLIKEMNRRYNIYIRKYFSHRQDLMQQLKTNERLNKTKIRMGLMRDNGQDK